MTDQTSFQSLTSIKPEELDAWLNENISSDLLEWMLPAKFVYVRPSMLPTTDDTYLRQNLYVGSIFLKALQPWEMVSAYRNAAGEVVLFRDYTELEAENFYRVQWNLHYRAVEKDCAEGVGCMKSLCAYHFAAKAMASKLVSTGSITPENLKDAVIALCRDFQDDKEDARSEEHET